MGKEREIYIEIIIFSSKFQNVGPINMYVI